MPRVCCNPPQWRTIPPEAQGAWRSAWPFARWNQDRLVANGNVDEETYRQSAVYIFKIWQIARKGNSLCPPPPTPDYHTFRKFWMQSDENWESTSLLRISKLDIFKVQNYTPNDPKLKSKKQTWIESYICRSEDRNSQIFTQFALLSAVFKIFHILGFFHFLSC